MFMEYPNLLDRKNSDFFGRWIRISKWRQKMHMRYYSDNFSDQNIKDIAVEMPIGLSCERNGENFKRASAYLDSGAQVCSISSATLKKLNIPLNVSGQMSVQMANGNESSHDTVLLDLRLKTTSETPIIILETPFIIMEDDAQTLIGANILRFFDIHITGLDVVHFQENESLLDLKKFEYPTIQKSSLTRPDYLKEAKKLAEKNLSDIKSRNRERLKPKKIESLFSDSAFKGFNNQNGTLVEFLKQRIRFLERQLDSKK